MKRNTMRLPIPSPIASPTSERQEKTTAEKKLKNMTFCIQGSSGSISFGETGLPLSEPTPGGKWDIALKGEYSIIYTFRKKGSEVGRAGITLYPDNCRHLTVKSIFDGIATVKECYLS